MEVLGRTLISPFNNFWKTFSQDISINKEFIEQGHSLIFQDQGLDQTTSFPPRWIELPDPDLAYHVAHELSHLVLNSKKYPRLLIEKQFKNDNDQNRIKDDLQELVDHIAINFLLKPFEFRNDFITQNTASGAIRGLSTSPVPKKNDPWLITWAIRYCELKVELNPNQWSKIEMLYQERVPKICRIGEDLFSEIPSEGIDTQTKALEFMKESRQILGLDSKSFPILDSFSENLF